MPNPVVVGAMVAKSAFNMGKAGFNWLRAKNDKYEISPQQKKALASATNQSNLGLGVEGFNTGVNQIKAQTDVANQKINQNLYSSGLENSFAVGDTKAKVQKVSVSQIANLAIKIAERNKEFRKSASVRLENMNLQIDAEKRAFEKNRKERMTNSAFAFLSATADTGVKAYEAKQSFDANTVESDNIKQINKEIPFVAEYTKTIDQKFEQNENVMDYIKGLEITPETEEGLKNYLLNLYESESKLIKIK
jgi:hypothetical protein